MMVDFGATITDSDERKLHELNLGLVSSSGTTHQQILRYRLPPESELAGFGIEGFRRRLEERVTNSVGSTGFHMVDKAVEYDGNPSIEIHLTERALVQYRELERAAMIRDSAVYNAKGITF